MVLLFSLNYIYIAYWCSLLWFECDVHQFTVLTDQNPESEDTPSIFQIKSFSNRWLVTVTIQNVKLKHSLTICTLSISRSVEQVRYWTCFVCIVHFDVFELRCSQLSRFSVVGSLLRGETSGKAIKTVLLMRNVHQILILKKVFFFKIVDDQRAEMHTVQVQKFNKTDR